MVDSISHETAAVAQQDLSTPAMAVYLTQQCYKLAYLANEVSGSINT